MAKKSNGKRKYGPRKTKAERERLIRDATLLLQASKHRKLRTKDVAAKLGVSVQWIYYNVGEVVRLRHAA